MIDKKEMYKLVGLPYENYRDNKAWGCIAPMYLSNPETLKLRYDWDVVENLLDLYKKNFKEISMTEIQTGDIIVLKMPMGLWHIMVYIEGDKFLHCTKISSMEVIKLSDYYRHRIKGVFRWEQ